MDSEGVKTSILKRDALGRVTLGREQREALLDEFEHSGMKGQPFARIAGVNYQTFASWIQKRRHARGDYPLYGTSFWLPQIIKDKLTQVDWQVGL